MRLSYNAFCKSSVLLFLTCLFSNVAFAQDWVESMRSPNANFYSIRSQFENYWSTRDISEKGKGYKVFKRWEHFVEPRVYPTGDLSVLRQAADNYAAFLTTYNNPKGGKPTGSSNLIASATWTPMGPMGPISGSAGSQLLKSGRVNFITLHPTNTSILWAGAPAGGLWKSTNGGVTWSTNTDQLPVTGCSDLAIDPTNTNIMYLATGDGDAGDTPSIGVLKSTNGGTSWTTTGLSFAMTNNAQIRRLIINPNNPQVLLAATNYGIYRTTNGGTSWSVVNSSTCHDLEFKPGNPSVVYATGSAFRMSTNGGTSFTTISSGIPISGVSRMAIAVTPADTNYVYVIAANSSNNGLLGVYRSVSGGTTFSQVAGSTLNLLGWSSTGNDTGGQGWYDLCIAASPLDKNEVVTGGVNVWRTTDGGSNWSLYGHWVGSGAPFTHADHHDLEYSAAGVLYNTNDGTIYRRSSTSWVELSGNMNISQIYRIGMSSLTANKWITGHQDNGTSIWNGSVYAAKLGGDGMDCFFDRTNDQNVFGEYQNGSMMKSTNGGSSWASCKSGLPTSGPWLTIWKQDPVVASRLYCGYSQMYVSNNLAGSWTQLAALPGSGNIVEFAIAPSNNQVIYVIRGQGIFKTTNGGTSWTTIVGTIPVSSARPMYISIDPTDANNAWVVLSGFSAGNKVYMTTNGGTSWTNVSYNLPNLPANCCVYQPGSNDRIYIGMDVGIYFKDNSSTSWTLYNTGLPNVPVSELEISPASPTLLHAATYGRGVWVASTFSSGGAPVSGFTVNTGLVCSGSVVTFSDQSTNGPTAWSWSVTPNVGVTVFTSSNGNANISFANGGTYTVSLQASNNIGAGTSFTQTITILPSPSLTITANAQTVCAGSPVSFTASGGSAYQWSHNGGGAAAVTFTPAAITVYTLNASSSSGCTASKTTTVYVGPAANLQISSAPAVCKGSAITLTATGAVTYTWSDNSTGAALSVTPAASGSYWVKGITSANCLAYATKQVTVLPLPSLSITASSTLVCAGEQFTLFATGADTYTWMPGNIEGDWNLFTVQQSTTFSLAATDMNGCSASKPVEIVVDPCTDLGSAIHLDQLVFSLFPNPSRGMLTITGPAAAMSGIKIEMRDITGRLVMDRVLESGAKASATIDISRLALGTYFVTLSGAKSSSAPVRIIRE